MLIFLYGDDNLRVKERLDDMRKKFVDKFDAAGMNVDEFSLKVADDVESLRPRVSEAAMSAPFLSEKRMIIVRGLLSFIRKPQTADWQSFLSRIPESTICILVDEVTPEKAEKTTLFGEMKGQPDVYAYPFPVLTGESLVKWVATRATELQLALSPALARELANRIGENPWQIDLELQKLKAYAGQESVTQEMIEELVRPSAGESNVFSLMDSLTAGRLDTTIKDLARERQSGSEEFSLFGMLLRQIRLLLQVRAVLDVNPNAVVAKELALHPFVAQKLVAENKKHSKADLETLHALAVDLDKSMKRGLSPKLAVDRLVAAFLQKT